MNKEILQKAANQARGLAIDAVASCKSGHLGLPLGAAEIGAVLYGEALQLNPDMPRWINRDRFILSAGRGSMFLYGWLHLSGFDLSLEELKNFRVLGSKTPGHPEYKEAPGVECTTGPLGQGVGNAVGFAISQKNAQKKFNTADHTILDNHIVALTDEDCIRESISQEALSLAGRLGLDNLILIYGSSDASCDTQDDLLERRDTEKIFELLGWDVVTIDGHDLDAVLMAFKNAKARAGKPQLIIAKTQIDHISLELNGSWKGHFRISEAFANARASLGLPEDIFFISEEVRLYMADIKARRVESYNEWKVIYESWKSANRELVFSFEMIEDFSIDSNLFKSIAIKEVPDLRITGEGQNNKQTLQSYNLRLLGLSITGLCVLVLGAFLTGVTIFKLFQDTSTPIWLFLVSITFFAFAKKCFEDLYSKTLMFFKRE